MRLIVAGSRDCKDKQIIREAILKGLEELDIKPTIMIHGDAAGVDKISGEICKEMGFNIVKYPAKWKDIAGKDPKYIKINTYGKYYTKAGIERNELMAQNADALIAINLGTSGTENMIQLAYKYKLKVYVYEPNTEEAYGINFWDE